MKKDSLENIEKNRNTTDQINWYERRAQLVKQISADNLSNNFSVFAIRQQITRFIETLRYWEMIKNVPGNILECGVAGGNFLFAMAHFSSIYEPQHYKRKTFKSRMCRAKGIRDC